MATTLDADTNRHVFIMDIPNNKVQIDNNNMTITTTHNYKSSKTLLIGAYRPTTEGTLSDVKASAKIYSFRIYEGKYLERDLVPCIDSNNIVGLYDLVNNVFYQNAGTGSFIAGDIVPNPNIETPIYNTTGEQNIKISGKNLFRETQNKKDITEQFKNIIYGDFNIVQGETYTLSLDTNNNDGRIYLNEDYFVHAMIPCDGTRKTYTTTAKKTGNYNNVILIKTRDDVSTAYNISNIMLEKKSTASSFEPYSETVYKINLGKNLFNPIYEVEKQYDANGNERATAYYSLNNNIISSNKSNNTYGACFFNKIRLMAGTYTFSFNISQSDNTTTSARVRIRNFDKSSNIYANYLDISKGSFETQFILTQSTTVGLMVLPSNDSDGTLYLSNIQLEKNDSVSQYEPYKTPIELCKIGDYQDYIAKSTGKNLFDGTLYNTQVGSNSGITGSTTRVANVNLGGTSTTYLKAGTYTLSIDDLDYCTVLTKNDNTIIDNWATSWQALPFTFTTTQDAYLLFTGRKLDNSTITPSDYKPMLNEGAIALPYEPFGKGKWYKHSKIGKIVLNGNETWIYSAGNVVFYSDVIRELAIPSTIYYCNRFFHVDTTITYANMKNGETKYDSSTSTRLIFKMTDYTTVADFKTWLSNNNVTIYYVLVTPTYEEITDSELLSQLEALEGAKSYNNQTYISQTDNILPFIIAADALKKND